MSYQGQFIDGTLLAEIETITTTAGIIVGPTGGNINLLNGNNITVTGVAATSTLTVDVTGTTDHAIQVGDATGSLDSIAIGAATQVMQSGGAGANPAWSTTTYPATSLTGDVIYASGADTLAALVFDNTATRYLANTGGGATIPAWAQIDLSNGTTGILTVTQGGTGIADPTDHSLLVGSGAAVMTALGVAGNGEIPIGSAGADPVLAAITSARDLEVTNGAGTIDVTLTDNAHNAAIHGWNGSTIETPSVTVAAAAGVITLSVERSGGGDLTVVFSDGFYDWDTTPADTIVDPFHP